MFEVCAVHRICCQLETVAVADFDVERRRDIPLWIIIVSVVVGFILLALVIIFLWKVRIICHSAVHMRNHLYGTGCIPSNFCDCRFSLGLTRNFQKH